jgi:hypothetical protein
MGGGAGATPSACMRFGLGTKTPGDTTGTAKTANTKPVHTIFFSNIFFSFVPGAWKWRIPGTATKLMKASRSLKEASESAWYAEHEITI